MGIALPNFSKKWVFMASLGACILFLLSPLSSFAKDKKQQTPQPVAVTVEPVKQGYFYDLVQEVGKLRAVASSDLSFTAANKITKIYFNNGDKVRKGDLIAQLDNTEAKADLDKSKSTLALAQTNVDRVNDLLQREPYALSKQNVDEVKEKLDLAKADYQQKLAAMKDYQIIAPFDGQLTSFTQSVGSHIAADTALVTLYQLTPVEVDYAVSQKDFGKANKGQRVSVTVDAYKDRTFYGQVSYVAPAIDPNSGRVTIRAKLDNPDYALAPGMFAKIKHYFGHRETQLLVPQNSVQANNEERYVWVVTKNRVQKRDVQLGKNTNNGYVAVTQGLKQDELVVKTGMQNLTSSSTIHILEPKQDKPDKTSSDAPHTDNGVSH
ncbi:efflux RND transporter periplasmic adaptor subunit [Parashewanella curva]|uniref:Efflux RND transporter periplasmic adaptor subunit n=1 Tax=Parashewanella curva TaxID=2338552 RepID=A0A3L8PTG6_9GAMM|nr:efflux RND transporter periplasmic adaptor subunit [Parashewanella curva]RLV58690.1 efflux RND transporter periplasmic adaptor subunit [Parashewanella curva]